MFPLLALSQLVFLYYAKLTQFGLLQDPGFFASGNSIFKSIFDSFKLSLSLRIFMFIR